MKKSISLLRNGGRQIDQLPVGGNSLGRNLPLCMLVVWLGGGIGVIIPNLMPYWLNRGITIEQVWVLQGVFALTLALCTVPFGCLADVKGRKGCMMFGVTLHLCGELGYLFGDSFWAFLAAEVLMGLGTALISGADSALLYDTLKVRGEQKDNPRWSGLGAAGCFIVTAIGCLIGGPIAAVDDKLPFVVSSCCVLLQLLAVLCITEPMVAQERQLVRWQHLGTVFRFCFQPGSSQLWLIAGWSLVTVGTWLAVWFYPLCFKRIGLTTNQQGAVFAFYNMVAGIASLSARRYKGPSSVSKAFLGFAVLIVLAHLLFGMVVTIWAFLFGALHQVVRGIAPVLFGHALHAQTPSEVRATVLSVQGACATLVYGAINLRLGVCIESFGIQVVLVAIGLGYLAVATCLWMVRPEQR